MEEKRPEVVGVDGIDEFFGDDVEEEEKRDQSRNMADRCVKGSSCSFSFLVFV